MNLRRGLGNLERLEVRQQDILLGVPPPCSPGKPPGSVEQILRSADAVLEASTTQRSLDKVGHLPVDSGSLREKGLEKMKADLAGNPGELEAQLKQAPSLV